MTSALFTFWPFSGRARVFSLPPGHLARVCIVWRAHADQLGSRPVHRNRQRR
ncbi:hypothetical protein [Nocardia aurantiaca]|uniref:Uncharacterized protein n=1 Tax=Nocardia aurantiaca TaxID=2675850 RepID=A0A6I3KU19_9NOCA|nr:hypothetical protein [Nocardia aurantiaca]MTE14303.1 hypothetical protein [Nocardia aurantiaca]